MRRYITVLLAILMVFTATNLVFADNDVVGSDVSDSGSGQNTDENLVINGTFDAVSDDGAAPLNWEVNNSSAVSIVDDEENGSCLYISSQEPDIIRAVQQIPVEPGAYYLLSCDIKTRGVAEGQGASITVLDSFAYSEQLYDDNDWTHVTIIGRTYEQQTEIEFALSLGTSNMPSSGEAWFDNASVQKYDGVPGEFLDLFIEHFYDTGDESSEPTKGEPYVPPTQTETDIKGMPHKGTMIIITMLTAAVCAVLYVTFIKGEQGRLKSKINPRLLLLGIIVLGLIIRIICNAVFTSLKGTYGHSTDILCFTAWGGRLLDHGTSGFYAAGWCDYPPAYMYICGLCAKIARLFGVTTYGYSAAEALIFKMPTILCDLAATYVIYRTARRFNCTERTSLILSCFVALNPAFIFISSVWAQMDMMLALLLVLTFIWLIKGVEKAEGAKDLPFIAPDMIVTGAIYGLAVSLKPQALMAGPIFAAAFIYYIIVSIKNKRLLESVVTTALSAVCAFAVIILPALPFTGEQEGLWLLDKYLGTATSYEYATIEAFNLFALMGGNWINVRQPITGNDGMTYLQLGTALMALVIIVAILFFIFGDKKNKGIIFLTCAFMLAGIFTLGHYMHERYLFPVLLLLLAAAVYYRDRRLYIAFFGFTCSMLLNTMAAFIITDAESIVRYQFYDDILTIGSLMTLLTFAWLTYVCYSLLIGKGAGKYYAFSDDSAKNKK